MRQQRLTAINMSFKPSYFKTELFKVLSNPVRIQILEMLRHGENSVNAIAEWLEVEASSISQQLAILRRSNLVISRRQGIQIFYAVRDPELFKVLDAAVEVFNNYLFEIRDRLEQLE
jgi:DNA-binding transcriptional ArsR family regulator